MFEIWNHNNLLIGVFYWSHDWPYIQNEHEFNIESWQFMTPSYAKNNSYTEIWGRGSRSLRERLVRIVISFSTADYLTQFSFGSLVLIEVEARLHLAGRLTLTRTSVERHVFDIKYILNVERKIIGYVQIFCMDTGDADRFQTVWNNWFL